MLVLNLRMLFVGHFPDLINRPSHSCLLPSTMLKQPWVTSHRFRKLRSSPRILTVLERQRERGRLPTSRMHLRPRITPNNSKLIPKQLPFLQHKVKCSYVVIPIIPPLNSSLSIPCSLTGVANRCYHKITNSIHSFPCNNQCHPKWKHLVISNSKCKGSIINSNSSVIKFRLHRHNNHYLSRNRNRNITFQTQRLITAVRPRRSCPHIHR